MWLGKEPRKWFIFLKKFKNFFIFLAKSTSILRSHLKSRHPDLFAEKLEADQNSSKWKAPKRKAPQDTNSFEIAVKSVSECLEQSNHSFVAIESPARSQASLSDVHDCKEFYNIFMKCEYISSENFWFLVKIVVQQRFFRILDLGSE